MKKARDIKAIEGIRERILEAALSIIIQKGYPSLTMRGLAAEIGMTAPNIYNYFKSKDELYITLEIRGFDMLHKQLLKAYKRRSDPFQRGIELARAYLDFGLTHSSYYDIMFTYPTPKHNDYVGTPLEKLSEIEYRTSMEIVVLALKVVAAFMGKTADPADDAVQRRFIAAWSLLHGMISLYNSRIMGYTSLDAKAQYEELITEFVRLLPRLGA